MYCRSSGEEFIKYQANSSCVIMSLILMPALFYKTLILQGEIWCWKGKLRRNCSPIGTIIQTLFVPNQEPASAWIFGNSSVRVGTQGLFYVIYQTWDAVFHHQMKHREIRKIRRAAEYFWRTSRCFIWWWNTVSNVWYFFSNKIIFEGEIKDANTEQFFIRFPNAH